MLRLVIFIALSIFSATFGINNISPNVIGDATITEDAPWMVSLQIKEGDFAYCGASIIKSSNESRVEESVQIVVLNKIEEATKITDTCSGWLVTAASCLNGVNVDTVIATLGNLNLTKEDKNESPCTIVKTHSHEKYNDTTFENDIGLIHVRFNRTLITFNEADEDANLCDEENTPVLQHWPEHTLNETDYPRINASVYGWGLKMEIGPLQVDLYNTTLPLKTDKECADDYGIDIFKPMSMICAGGQGLGPCSYDTGGPLTCQYTNDAEGNETTHKYLCGITSFGNGCRPDSYPAVFTDVVNFVEWIDETIADNSS